MKTTRWLPFLCAALAAAVLLGPAAAFAQGAPQTFEGFFETVPSGDYAKIMLGKLFPNLVGGDGVSAGNSAFVDLFGVFNAALLLAASALVGWHIVSGMVNTAHDGRALGNDWHQIWAPVRVSVGIASLAPALGGFCLAQLLVIKVALWGVGLADTLWALYVQSIVNDGKVVMSVDYPANNDVIKDALRNEICVAAAKRTPVAEMTVGLWSRTPVAMDPKETSLLGTTTFDFGEICGRIAIKGQEIGAIGAVASLVGMEGGETSSTLAMNQARVDAFRNLLVELAPIASTLADSEMGTARFSESQAVQIERARDNFQRTINAAAKSYADALNGSAREVFLQKASGAGFATAGTWYMTIANMSAQVTGAAGVKPMVVASEPTKLSAHDAEPIIAALVQFDAFWSSRFQTAMPLEDGNPWTGNGAATVGNPNGPFDQIFGGLFMAAVKVMSTTDAANPLVALVNQGHYMLDATWTALIGAGALYGLAGGADKGIDEFMNSGLGKMVNFVTLGGSGVLAKAVGGAVSAILQFVTPLVWMLFFGMFAVGALHAYLLPMLPYILWLFAILGWLVFVVEAMLAAPLWAFVHCRMDGNSFVSNEQRAGYMLLFNLFTRPALLLFGLVIGFATFGVIIDFMNKTAFTAIRAATSGSTFGPIGAFSMIAILAYLHYFLAIRSFSLIHLVPDRVSRWIGQGGENLGEERDTEEAKRFITGVVVAGTKGGIVGGARQAALRPLPPNGPGGGNVAGGGGGGGSAAPQGGKKSTTS